MPVLGANKEIETVANRNYFSPNIFISEFKNKSALAPGNWMMNFNLNMIITVKLKVLLK
jgi:hypothetical protein